MRRGSENGERSTRFDPIAMPIKHQQDFKHVEGQQTHLGIRAAFSEAPRNNRTDASVCRGNMENLLILSGHFLSLDMLFSCLHARMLVMCDSQCRIELLPCR